MIGLRKVETPSQFVDDMAGGWLKSYADTPDGRGCVEWTDDPKKARGFETRFDAMEFWRTPSKTVPKRPDGKPNRPLTAFTVSVEELPA